MSDTVTREPDVEIEVVTYYGWRCNDCDATNEGRGWITLGDAENDMAGHECEAPE